MLQFVVVYLPLFLNSKHLQFDQFDFVYDKLILYYFFYGRFLGWDSKTMLIKICFSVVHFYKFYVESVTTVNAIFFPVFVFQVLFCKSAAIQIDFWFLPTYDSHLDDIRKQRVQSRSPSSLAQMEVLADTTIWIHEGFSLRHLLPLPWINTLRYCKFSLEDISSHNQI